MNNLHLAAIVPPCSPENLKKKKQEMDGNSVPQLQKEQYLTIVQYSCSIVSYPINSFCANIWSNSGNPRPFGGLGHWSLHAILVCTYSIFLIPYYYPHTCSNRGCQTVVFTQCQSHHPQSSHGEWVGSIAC